MISEKSFLIATSVLFLLTCVVVPLGALGFLVFLTLTSVAVEVFSTLLFDGICVGSLVLRCLFGAVMADEDLFLAVLAFTEPDFSPPTFLPLLLCAESVG